MALHDLNKPPDEGQEMVVPDLNEKLPDEESERAPGNQPDGHAILPVNPLDLNFTPVQEDDQLQAAITLRYQHEGA
ncbi:hypothetical protein ACP70R_000256 [Stipagrostis hirtigluma subsp. patula]